jgi:hypothetical protein
MTDQVLERYDEILEDLRAQMLKNEEDIKKTTDNVIMWMYLDRKYNLQYQCYITMTEKARYLQNRGNP